MEDLISRQDAIDAVAWRPAPEPYKEVPND